MLLEFVHDNLHINFHKVIVVITLSHPDKVVLHQVYKGKCSNLQFLTMKVILGNSFAKFYRLVTRVSGSSDTYINTNIDSNIKRLYQFLPFLH